MTGCTKYQPASAVAWPGGRKPCSRCCDDVDGGGCGRNICILGLNRQKKTFKPLSPVLLLLLLLHDVGGDVGVLDVPEGVLRVDGSAVGRVGVVGAGRDDVVVGLGRGEEPVRLQVVVAQVLGRVHALDLMVNKK